MNQMLKDLALEHADLWAGTVMEKIIRQDILFEDESSLEKHLFESSRLIAEQDDRYDEEPRDPEPPITDEQLEQYGNEWLSDDSVLVDRPF